MTRINWNSTSKRFYNAGLDRVVLYTQGNPGVPWFGLYSVEEAPTGGEAEPYYLDGFKYLQLSSLEEYAATINALQVPEEFGQCDGVSYVAQGLYATQQHRESFGLCYRVLTGSDTQKLGTWYKLHIIYNALASPTSYQKSTIHDEPSMEFYSWEIKTRAKEFPGIKPVAHLIIDSRTADPVHLKTLEGFLYGDVDQDPILLEPSQIATILSGDPFEIDDSDELVEGVEED